MFSECIQYFHECKNSRLNHRVCFQKYLLKISNYTLRKKDQHPLVFHSFCCVNIFYWSKSLQHKPIFLNPFKRTGHCAHILFQRKVWDKVSSLQIHTQQKISRIFNLVKSYFHQERRSRNERVIFIKKGGQEMKELFSSRNENKK